MAVDDRQSKTEKLAQEVLTLARNTLLVNLRFLDAAVSQMEPVPQKGHGMFTDAGSLYFDPEYILRVYREEHNRVARDLLHVLFHCTLRHMYPPDGVDSGLWDIACDIAVEYAITEFAVTAVFCEREKKQAEITGRMQWELGMLTTEKIYACLQKYPAWLPPADKLSELFRADEHHVSGYECSSRNAEVWKNISLRMNVDLETFARRQSDRAGAFLQNLKEVNREKHDWTRFLRQFASKRDTIKTNSDEFDMIFYTYGMSLNSNVPLIEPVEYRPPERPRDFVIAADICGLLKNSPVRDFLSRAWEVLKSTGTAGSPVKLHLMFVKNGELEETEILADGEMEEFTKHLEVRPREETDFRPVFIRTDELIAGGKLKNMKGLIYFTDGYGQFPSKKPAYDTAFIFVNDDYSTPAVPPWAMRLVLQKTEVE